MKRALTSAINPPVTRLASLALAALLLGCTLGPDFNSPKAPAETTYTPNGEAEHQAGDQRIAMDRKITGDWWSLYRSAPLNAVLEQAIAGNRSLVAAQASLAATVSYTHLRAHE